MHRGEFDELQMSSADTTGCGNLPHSDFLSELQAMLAFFTDNLAHSTREWERGQGGSKTSPH